MIATFKIKLQFENLVKGFRAVGECEPTRAVAARAYEAGSERSGGDCFGHGYTFAAIRRAWRRRSGSLAGTILWLREAASSGRGKELRRRELYEMTGGQWRHFRGKEGMARRAGKGV